MDFQNMNIWCWLIPALIGIICGILGYLWGKGSVEVVDHTADLKLLRDKNIWRLVTKKYPYGQQQ